MKVTLQISLTYKKISVIDEPDYSEERERVYLSKKELISYVREAIECWSGQLPNGHPLRSVSVEDVR